MAADDLARGLARQRGDFSFQLPHSSLARVVVDHALQCRIRQLGQLGLQSVLFQLARHEEAFGNLQFLRGGVAGQFDHLQPVA